MNEYFVSEFLKRNEDCLFPNSKYADAYIDDLLLSLPDEMEFTLNSIVFRNPSTLQLISVFPGILGVDRFYMGEIKKGIIKYITFGGLGIWWVKDIISAKERCRLYNCEKLLQAISDPSIGVKKDNAGLSFDQAKNVAREVAPLIKDLAKETKKGAHEIGKGFYIN